MNLHHSLFTNGAQLITLFKKNLFESCIFDYQDDGATMQILYLNWP